MIKIKQTKMLFIALGLVVSSLLGVLSFNTSNVQAYTCFDPASPTDIYEYHETDGKCWKVRFTDRQQNPPIATCNNGSCACPGGAPFVLNGQCKQTCPAGDQYHDDNNSCWYKNGYTSEDTQKIAPTNNDGTPISAGNSACTNGFIYMPSGNGNSGPGCYDRSSDGSFPCGPDQEVVNNDGVRECSDTGKPHLIPKDKKQSADKTKLNAECAKKYPGDAKQAERMACQAAANNPDQDCSQQPNQAQRDACKAGKEASTVTPPPATNNGGTGTNCGESETVLISCQGKGIQALGDVLRIIISVLTTLIGILAVGGLAWASVLYAKAEDNASNTAQAKEIIRNVAIGILVYGFLIAIVNWLVPGGVIG